MNKLTILFFLFISTAPLTYASEPVSAQDSIQNLFDSYMVKYNRYIKEQKLPSEPELYQNTVMLISNSKPSSAVSAIDFNRQVTEFLDSLINQGVTYVTWESVDIQMLDSNIAIVRNVAVRYKKSGEVLNRVGATYFVSKLSNNWLIAAFAIHDPSSNKPI